MAAYENRAYTGDDFVSVGMDEKKVRFNNFILKPDYYSHSNSRRNQNKEQNRHQINQNETFGGRISNSCSRA